MIVEQKNLGQGSPLRKKIDGGSESCFLRIPKKRRIDLDEGQADEVEDGRHLEIKLLKKIIIEVQFLETQVS